MREGYDVARCGEADLLPGIPKTNNGLERSNRQDKEDDDYAVEAITAFIPHSLKWVQMISQQDKPFGEEYSKEVWNKKTMAKANELIESGATKCVWSYIVNGRQKWLMLSSRQFARLDKSLSIEDQRRSVQDWVDTFRRILRNPHAETRDLDFEQMEDWLRSGKKLPTTEREVGKALGL